MIPRKSDLALLPASPSRATLCSCISVLAVALSTASAGWLSEERATATGSSPSSGQVVQPPGPVVFGVTRRARHGRRLMSTPYSYYDCVVTLRGDTACAHTFAAQVPVTKDAIVGPETLKCSVALFS